MKMDPLVNNGTFSPLRFLHLKNNSVIFWEEQDRIHLGEKDGT